MAELPKFPRVKGKRGRRTRCWRQILDRKWKYGRFVLGGYPAIIIGTVRLLWTWLWGRYHVPQNAFLVRKQIATCAVFLHSRCHAMSSKSKSAITCFRSSLSWLVGDVFNPMYPFLCLNLVLLRQSCPQWPIFHIVLSDYKSKFQSIRLLITQ